jgi:hypothetical protein
MPNLNTAILLPKPILPVPMRPKQTPGKVPRKLIPSPFPLDTTVSRTSSFFDVDFPHTPLAHSH